MFNRIIVWGLILLITFAVAGCQEQLQKQKPLGDPLAYGPDANTIVITDDFASKAIKATGGREKWANAKKLEFDCVVTFYNKDGSSYLTEQHHDIYPWSNAIRISAVKPQGKFVWLLSGDSLSAELPERARTQYDVRSTMYAVRYIMTAPVRFLDESVEFAKYTGPIRMEGLWYYPIRCSTLGSKSMGYEPRQVVFYQNRENSFVDIVRFASTAGMKSLMVRGYDYRELKEAGLLLPTKIEMFRTDSVGVVQRRLLKIDYHKPGSAAGYTEGE